MAERKGKPQGARFTMILTPEDERLLDRLVADVYEEMGSATRTQIVRMALRLMAQDRNVIA